MNEKEEMNFNNYNPSRNEIIQSYKVKATVFLKTKEIIFIKTSDERYYHGRIIKIYDEYFSLKDKFQNVIPITFSELKKLEKYVNKMEEKQ